jgi:hypothetical protein
MIQPGTSVASGKDFPKPSYSGVPSGVREFAYLFGVCCSREQMQREMRTRSECLPKTEASFIEPMEGLLSKLPEGTQFSSYSTTMPSCRPH